LPFVTIDGEDAKDFDDAVFCEQRNDGWRLWVAIADVSHYVTPDSLLDREAQKRGTSVYFPGRVIPMLPEALSNGLCSLNPNVDRLVIVCEMQISKKGKMTGYQFYEAVIHSHARLTYSQVNVMLSKSESNVVKRMSRENLTNFPQVSALYQLYGVLKEARSIRGAMDFDTQEVQFQFNNSRKIEGIFPVERNDAHKLIEECMLCANVAAASLLGKLKLPAIYRNHNGPTPLKLKNLRTFLGTKGLTLSGGNNPTPIHYDQLLNSIEKRSDAGVIQKMVLRSLSQAEYNSDNAGHFGLAFSAYAHFTSPIRRYPDLLVHRAIRSVIRGQQTGSLLKRVTRSIVNVGYEPVKRISGAPKLDATTAYPYDMKSMASIAGHCSQVSRRADKASWDVEAWLKCDYMRNAVGDTFYGTITTVTKFGLFVELNDTKIEGLIPISSLSNEFYAFDEDKQELVGNEQRNIYAVGGAVEIRIEQVDMKQRRIKFSLVSFRA